MFSSIAGRSVVVTGASRGIGRGIARVFASKGARVLLVARDHRTGRGGGGGDPGRGRARDRLCCRCREPGGR